MQMPNPNSTNESGATTPSASPLIQIILLEDSPMDAQVFQRFLSKSMEPERYWLIHTKRLSKALKLLQRKFFDVAVIDLTLPDSQGLQSLNEIHALCPELPIIVLTGTGEEKMGLEAIEHGAQDFLIKGDLDSHGLTRSIRYAISRNTISKNLKQAIEHAEYRAAHDHLTGLPNRQMFDFALQQTVFQAKRNPQFFGILFVDLDGFKPVNDTYGHAFGDFVLQTIAKRIQKNLRESDTVARIGGDEFAIILLNLHRPDDAGYVAKKILSSICEPIETFGHAVEASTSIGIALYPMDSEEPQNLLNAADSAMYDAKKSGKNQIRFFNPMIHAQVSETNEMETHLMEAWNKREFLVYYQPQFDLKTNTLIGLEALARWKYRGVGLVTAGDFIPFAERMGLIDSINEWILIEVCETLKRFAVSENFRISLNLSDRQLRQESLVSMVQRVLRDTKTEPHRLCFEFKEKAAFLDTSRNLSNLKDLKKLGVKLALDHFGIGYSSLTYLKILPIDEIKIDVSLIQKFKHQSDEADLTAAIIRAAHCLNLKVSAEGVEAQEQVDTLRHLNCDFAQGFYLGRPTSLENIEKQITTLGGGSQPISSKEAK